MRWGRTARSLAEGRQGRYAHTEAETRGAVGVHSSAAPGSITDCLLEGSGCIERPGTEADQCRLQRGPPYQTHTVHMLGAGAAAAHGPTPTLLLFFLFSNKLHTAAANKQPTSSGCVLTAKRGATHHMSR